ncbi:dethiobiotin synthetase [Photobacterium aquae]|uniref:Dethiobiotin synthetase n=1 Tax=Photobacterium aquae TaxID=1195763 RepID=A0A0J1GYW3_9GAMM|nr:hypothetical protein [Photobacterium aquae]KLV04826.1 dethiobiotin synthetase [Photobacterium aquae]
MADHENYRVAIDILRCHLGMSAEEARKELGLDQETNQHEAESQGALLDLLNKS